MLMNPEVQFMKSARYSTIFYAEAYKNHLRYPVPTFVVELESDLSAF